MSETKEIEIWEFERKSFIHWTSPFLSDDPPHFVSRDKQGLQQLNDYQLNEAYAFDIEDEWKIEKEWIYSDHFNSIKWSRNEFSSSYLCRKRCWKRKAKKKEFNSACANLNMMNDKGWNHDENTLYSEYVVYEIEMYQCPKWKRYKNGWFDVEMKPLKHVQTPFDIKLPVNTNHCRPNGIWKWAENWCCIDPSDNHNMYNNDDDIQSETTDIIQEYDISYLKDIDREQQQTESTKKKKKRIRIKKNAKKLFTKMRGNDDKRSKNEEENDASCMNDREREETDLLSRTEQNELFELFGVVDRGWEYGFRFSANDNDWNPEYNIISQCNYRRRTWLRGAIYDVSICCNNHNNHLFPALSVSESLSQSIMKSRSKANELMAAIDEYLKSGTIRSDSDMEKKEEDEEGMQSNDDQEYDNIGTFVMREILNGLLWHIHLCSISNVVDRLPHDDDDVLNERIGKLYFVEDARLRTGRINDFMSYLGGLEFNCDSLMNDVVDDVVKDVDFVSCDGVIDVCHELYCNLLCDLLYECAFHERKDVYSNTERIALMDRMNQVIVLYIVVKRECDLSVVSEMICVMSCIIGFMERANKEDDVSNPLWVFDDLLNIGGEFAHAGATRFERSCLFFPDLLTSLKQCIYILSKEKKEKLCTLNRTLCAHVTKGMLAMLESYFVSLHDNMCASTVVQLMQIFISLTDLYQDVMSEYPRRTFKELRSFLSEYHKLSITAAFDNIRENNSILCMFSQNDDADSRSRDVESISDELYTNDMDANNMKERHKRLVHHCKNDVVQNIWWEFIEDIVHLIDIDYELSVALYKGKIFCSHPVSGIECLAKKCGKAFAVSFKMNRYGLDTAYKLLLCGAHRIQDKFEVVQDEIGKENNNCNLKDCFSFVQFEICQRLSYWCDLSINRVAIWIKRAAEQERWCPNERICAAPFVTDCFRFIHNEFDIFFDHLMSFPNEGMAMAHVFFQRLQVLVETILHLMEMSILNHNHNNNNDRKKTHNSSVDEEYVSEMSKSDIKRKHILSKLSSLSLCVNRRKKVVELCGLKCLSQYVEKINVWHNCMQRIGDDEFDEELASICVKLSSLSRCMEIVHVLSGHLLNKIHNLSSPKEEILNNRFEIHKQKLIECAYKLSTACEEETRQCISRAMHGIVYRILSVQNVAYFEFKLYLIDRIAWTSAIRIGLFERIAHYMNTCSDHLRECDLQVIVHELAHRFSLYMRHVLTGYSMNPPRVFNGNSDVQYIVDDFEECGKLFCDFGLKQLYTDDKEEKEAHHPFYPYWQCVEEMKLSTLRLMQKHMVLMANRNKERKKELNQQQRTTNLNQRTKAILDKAVIRKIYDCTILHVLAHRAHDEAARSYVENFVQYRHRNRKLIIDLSQIWQTLRIIIHEGKDLPPPHEGKDSICDPYCVVNVMSFKLKRQTRVIGQTRDPKWDEALDFKLSKISQHIIIEFDVSSHDDHIGKYTERIEYAQRNVDEKWVYLYNHDNNKVNGQLLITIECQNLWNL